MAIEAMLSRTSTSRPVSVSRRLQCRQPIGVCVPTRRPVFTCIIFKPYSTLDRFSAQAAAEAAYGSVWLTPEDAYVTLGLAHCFEKSDEGKLADRFVIEPITANQLEALANGAPTCYKAVFGATLKDATSKDKSILPPDFANASYCENFETRSDACARTWLRPHALDNLLDIVPLGQIKDGFNFNLADKRVLNFENVVTDDDNIKQDMSIDAYSRAAKEEAAEKLAKDGARYEVQKKAVEDGDDDDDDVDALLA